MGVYLYRYILKGGDTMTNEERAYKIKELMVIQGIGKSELHRRSGLHLNTVRKIIDGKSGSNARTINAIAHGLGVNASILI
jgi:hypothetical protein